MKNISQFALIVCLLALTGVSHAQSNQPASPRVIELTADHDSRYRSDGKVAPTIEAAPGEPLILRVTAVRAKKTARDGSIHGLALLDKDLNAVPGWRFYLKPGVQDLSVIAPKEPGRYKAVCTIICSDMHDGMSFTLVVALPENKIAKE